MKPLLLATSNPHKIEEIAAVMGTLGIEVVGLDSLDEIPPEPVEDGDTFEANVRLKAIGYAIATGRMCLADDSGLEVDALGGAPGVHSARYAGIGPSAVGILTSPASSPRVSVAIVSAETGCTASANPVASVVTTNSRRVKPTFGSQLFKSSCMVVSPRGNRCGPLPTIRLANARLPR